MDEQLDRVLRYFSGLEHQEDKDFFEATMRKCYQEQAKRANLRLVTNAAVSLPGFDFSSQLRSIENPLAASHS